MYSGPRALPLFCKNQVKTYLPRPPAPNGAGGGMSLAWKDARTYPDSFRWGWDPPPSMCLQTFQNRQTPWPFSSRLICLRLRRNGPMVVSGLRSRGLSTLTGFRHPEMSETKVEVETSLLARSAERMAFSRITPKGVWESLPGPSSPVHVVVVLRVVPPHGPKNGQDLPLRVQPGMDGIPRPGQRATIGPPEQVVFPAGHGPVEHLP